MNSPADHEVPTARIGLLIPQLDVLSEPVLPPLLPPGTSLHTSRLRRTGPVNRETLAAMNREVLTAVDLLPLPLLQAVVYHCTMGSLLYDPAKLVAELAERARLPVVATALAVVQALRHLAARRVCLVTPYAAELNEDERGFLEQAGFEVLAVGGANIDDSAEMQTTPAATIAQWARRAFRPDADVVFISCTGLRSDPVIDALEAEFARPVVTSTSAMLWQLYGVLGATRRRTGLGRLFR